MIALSFSGGKDSSLALYELHKQGYEISCLFTTVWKENNKTVAHEESMRELKKLADRLEIPIHFIFTTFDTYEVDFITTLKQLKSQYQLTTVAFGDWYLKGHREWGEKQAAKVDLKACYPLWATEGEMLDKLQYFVRLGFKAKVIKVDEEKLPKNWIGRIIDEQFVEDIAEFDVCPMGEHGEYHTTVLDGPIFSK
jgi:diphthine-ammonia ligase